MKVMISLPMSGVPDEKVKERMKLLKERFDRYHIEVVDSFDTIEAEGKNHPGVYYLGRTLMNHLSDVDAVYFDLGWEKARGCRVERHICEEYGILIWDWTFFQNPNDAPVTGITMEDGNPMYSYDDKDGNYIEEFENPMLNMNHIPNIE